MRGILPFIPSEAFILVIIVLGLGLITGLISRRAVGMGLGLILLTIVARPFIKAILSSLPLWLFIPVVLFFGLTLLLRLTALIIGRGAADEMVGALAADVVRFLFRMLCFPLVVMWRWSRRT